LILWNFIKIFFKIEKKKILIKNNIKFKKKKKKKKKLKKKKNVHKPNGTRTHALQRTRQTLYHPATAAMVDLASSFGILNSKTRNLNFSKFLEYS